MGGEFIWTVSGVQTSFSHTVRIGVLVNFVVRVLPAADEHARLDVSFLDALPLIVVGIGTGLGVDTHFCVRGNQQADECAVGNLFTVSSVGVLDLFANLK